MKDDVIKCRHAKSQVTYPEFGKKQEIFLAQVDDDDHHHHHHHHDKHVHDFEACNALEAKIEAIKVSF